MKKRRHSLIAITVLLLLALLVGCPQAPATPSPEAESPTPTPGTTTTAPTPSPSPDGEEGQPAQAALSNVLTIPQLNFELDDLIGQKVWLLGVFGNTEFTGDGVGFLVESFRWLITSEKLPHHSFARLDGELPPADMNSAEILVYGEVKDFSRTYGKYTARPTPLVTVEKHTVLRPPARAEDWGGGSFFDAFSRAGFNLFSPDIVLAQEAGGTRAKDCDRALVISGGVDSNSNYSRYEDDVKAKFSKLKELGFSDEQIDVVYNDGDAVNVDGNNITDKKATKENIKDLLEEYANEMNASCTLTILVTDHGTGYRQDQGYHGARPALAGEDGKTYPESSFKVDLRSKVYRRNTYTNPSGDTWLFYLNKKTGRMELYKREGGNWVKKGSDTNGDGWITESEAGQDIDGDGDQDNAGMKEDSLGAWQHADNTWDTDGDGQDDVRGRWDGNKYVFERFKDGQWHEMGGDTDGDHDVDGDDGGVDWDLDGSKDDSVSFHEGINLWGDEVLWDDELADMLKPLQEKGIHIVVEMMQCFSGGFVDNLKGRVEKIVTAASENNKSFARENDAGRYENTFQLAFMENLEGIDLESWNRAFDRAKEVDTQEWVDDGSDPDTKNEYQIWEKPLLESESSFYEVDGIYTLTLQLPPEVAGKAHDFEIFFGLQQPRWDSGTMQEMPEGFSVREVPGGIGVISEAAFPSAPLVFKFSGTGEARSLRIHITDAEHRNLGYVEVPRTEPPVTRTPEIEDAAGRLAETTGIQDGREDVGTTSPADESQFIIDRLQEYIDDPETDEEQKDEARAIIDFLERAGESDRQWLIDFFMDAYQEAKEAARTVELSIPLAMGAESVSQDGQCQSTIRISYSATLSGQQGIVSVTSVILKVNGEVWHDSGSLSTNDYHNVVERTVGCGETFDAEVIVTTSDGRTSTNSASLTTPVPGS